MRQHSGKGLTTRAALGEARMASSEDRPDYLPLASALLVMAVLFGTAFIVAVAM